MTDVRVGDQIRLTTYEGHVGFGTPESRSVFQTQHEGTVVATWTSQRFGQSVDLECSIAHEDHKDDEALYLDDFDVSRINVETCSHCKGRGHVAVPAAVPVPTTEKSTS